MNNSLENKSFGKVYDISQAHNWSQVFWSFKGDIGEGFEIFDSEFEVLDKDIAVSWNLNDFVGCEGASLLWMSSQLAHQLQFISSPQMISEGPLPLVAAESFGRESGKRKDGMRLLEPQITWKEVRKKRWFHSSSPRNYSNVLHVSDRIGRSIFDVSSFWNVHLLTKRRSHVSGCGTLNSYYEGSWPSLHGDPNPRHYFFCLGQPDISCWLYLYWRW